MSQEAKEPQTIRIDEEGRYLVIVGVAKNAAPAERERDLDKPRAAFAAWWASGDKFKVIEVVEGVSIRVERVGDDVPSSE